MGHNFIKGTGQAIAVATLVGMTAPTATSLATPQVEPLKFHYNNGNLALQPAHQEATQGAEHSDTRATYRVQTGDSIASIAATFHVSAQSIVETNGLRGGAALHIGQKLQIPAPQNFVGDVVLPSSNPALAPVVATQAASKTTTRKSANAVAASAKVYVVKRGDTLSKIAARSGYSVAELVKHNGITNPNRIFVGQRISFPQIKSASTTATKAHASASKDGQKVTSPATASKSASTTAKAKSAPATKTQSTARSYTVRAGDTLSKIARTYRVSVNDIVKWNSLRSANVIFVGQKLLVSAPKSVQPAASTASKTAKSSTKTTTTPSTGSSSQKTSTKQNTSSSTKTSSTPSTSTTATTTGKKQLVTNNFPGYTYPDETVRAANDNKNYLVSIAVPTKAEVQKMVVDTAKKLGVDPRLALAHAYVESGFDATAVSPANAIGVMQVIPSSGTWAGSLVGRKLDLLKPADNITAGIAIIKWLQTNADSFEQGVAGYYQGLGGVKRNGMRPDTVRYVAKIKSAMSRF